MNGRRALVLVICILGVLVGFFLAGGELWHWLSARTHNHELNVTRIVWGMVIVTIAAIGIQLGDLVAALKTVVDILPALVAAIPVRFGGRRATDPPAPPGVATPPEGLPPSAVIPPANPPTRDQGEGP